MSSALRCNAVDFTLESRRLYAAMPIASELESYFRVYLPTCQVVRYGVHVVGDIGNPIIRVYVADVEEVEAVYSKPDVLEDALAVMILVVK